MQLLDEERSMDVKSLQRRLRAFAAARDWQAYHTPKNLAMALMVEAAELQELFQWLTPEESQQIAADPQRREALADELADVLLYLLQLADHTDVDLHEAVERKLVKNALKHRAKHPELEAPEPAKAEQSGARGHLLIDWENVQPRCEELGALAPEGTDVWLFHAPHQKPDIESFGRAYGAERVTLIPRTGAGKNALDFQLSYYIGYISARQPQACFVVVSNDTGYDPMLAHSRDLGFVARRCAVHRQSPRPAAAAAAAPRHIEVAPSVAASTEMQTLPAAAKSLSTAQTASRKAVAAPASVKTPASPARKVTPSEMKLLSAQLQGSPLAARPARRESLLNWLKSHLREANPQSPRVLHALAQLQSRKLVVIQDDAVSYPATAVAGAAAKRTTSSKALVAAPGAAAPAKKDTPQTTSQRTPAQMALSVLASLRKMTANRPTRRTGLLGLIETHTGTAADPKAMAVQVCALLEARQDVAFGLNGADVCYPRLAPQPSMPSAEPIILAQAALKD